MYLIDNIAAKPGKFPQLDGLRAIAIILVLFRHGISDFSKHFVTPDIHIGFQPFINFFFNGWIGVDLFFVLSGFLVGFHLLSNWPEDKSKLTFMAKYWLKRILRTFPLYFLILIVVYYGLVPFYQHSSVSPNKDLFRHTLFLQDYYGANFLVSLWSLATEEKFYFFSPFLIWFILIKKNSNTFFFITICSLILLSCGFVFNYLSNNEIDNYNAFFGEIRAPFHVAVNGILFGLIIAFFYQKKIFASYFSNHSNVIIIICSCLISALLLYKNWLDRTDDWLHVVLIILFLLLLFSITLYALIYSSNNISKFMSCSLIRFISKLSYSLYLVHLLVIPGVIVLCNKLNTLGASWSLIVIIYCLVYIFVSLFFSLLLHVLIERPFIQLKDKIKLTGSPDHIENLPKPDKIIS